MAIEVLTNEGVHALNVAASAGPRLVVEYACAGNKNDLGPESAKAYADITASDISAWASHEHMPCVAMLPSTVDFGSSTGVNAEAAQLEPRNAIDIEFSWLPSGLVEFDAIAVFARLYYGYAEYLPGEYTEGMIVWYRESNGETKYYRCISSISVVSTAASPSSDPEHWREVEMTNRVIGSNPPLRAPADDDSLILLHLSTADQPIKVGQGLEFDYKLRVFLNNVSFDMANKETCPVYLESLVPAGNAALQLGFLKEMAESMDAMRGIIAKVYR